MKTLLWITLSNLLISLLAFAGIFSLAVKKEFLKKITPLLVALSAGALMGTAFLHLIPEASATIMTTSAYTLSGFIVFFLIEKVLLWRHCHEQDCKIHTFAYMNLLGDSVHNFIDGIIIAASFLTDLSLGIATSLAVILHELPQELGDFGVLVHGGFTRAKALILNFLTALTAILGGVIGFFLISSEKVATSVLIPIAAGGFIYIAATDLIPELGKTVGFKKSMMNVTMFLLGVALMALLS